MLKQGIAHMNAIDNTQFAVTDITLGTLLDSLAGHAQLPLIFHYNGEPVRGGYHITEVKAGAFSALDCGANPEAWSEIFIQLWDIDEDGRTHMNAGKFAAIVRKVSEHVDLDGTAKLTFEVSDGIRPMQLYCAGTPALRDGALHVDLMPRPASCKPRDRWLAGQAESVPAACCAPSAETSPTAKCCG
jgi:hypothetical protein